MNVTRDTAVSIYCAAFVPYARFIACNDSAARAFAYHMLAVNRELCTMVMDAIGSWPSSEVELRELQRAYR